MRSWPSELSVRCEAATTKSLAVGRTSLRFVGGLIGSFQMIVSLSCDGIGSCLFEFDFPPQPEHFFAHAAERRRRRETC